MQQLFSKHPAFWRGVAGLLLGVGVTLIGLWLLGVSMASSPGGMEDVLLSIIGSPIIGFLWIVTAVGMGPPNIMGPIILLVTLCFLYFASGAVLFFLRGEPQTPRVIAWQIAIVVILVALGILGYMNPSERVNF